MIYGYELNFIKTHEMRLNNMEKVILILIDGMRPDAIENIPTVKKLMSKASYTMEATTVMPSVTLPCHMSLFHSVDPSRHGITTNVYSPQVRPVSGLCEVLLQNKKKCAFFYNWEALRDLSRPDSLTFSYFCKGGDIGYDKANNIVTDAAIEYLSKNQVDFTFLYMGYTDSVGHKYGWMSKEYISAINNSWDNIDRIINSLDDDYTIIITSDHGGHDRIHGTDTKEDMIIPLIIVGKDFKSNTIIPRANIKDIAPTIVKVLGVIPDKEWEGRCLV